jgi:hypothetical protein
MKLRTAAIVFTGLAALVAIAAIVLPLALTASVFGPGPAVPSDTAMIAHWEKHRTTLDQITDMLRRDPALNRLGLTWSDPDDPERAHVPAARIADYRDLMREASIISVSRGHRSVQFLFYASGVSVNGFGKSFRKRRGVTVCRNRKGRSRHSGGWPQKGAVAASDRRRLVAAARRKLNKRCHLFVPVRTGACAIAKRGGDGSVIRCLGFSAAGRRHGYGHNHCRSSAAGYIL